MKVIILAGGKGTRLTEETIVKPKPMVMVGDKPIISHIIEIYTKYGFNDFLIAAGYKYKIILKYFKKILKISKFKLLIPEKKLKQVEDYLN